MEGTRLPKPAAAFCCGSIPNSPALGTLWELSGKTFNSFNIFISRSSPTAAAPKAAEHAYHKASPHTRARESPFISVAEAQPATACPTIILLPSFLFLNCLFRLHLFPFRQFPFRRTGRHFEISKCPAPVTNPMPFKFDVPAHCRCHFYSTVQGKLVRGALPTVNFIHSRRISSLRKVHLSDDGIWCKGVLMGKKISATASAHHFALVELLGYHQRHHCHCELDGGHSGNH